MNSEKEIPNLKAISNAQLLEEVHSLVKEERRIGLEILYRLKEIASRRLYAEVGYSSMFTYCVQELKYPESTAFRLLGAMNLLSELPEIEEKVQSGDLSVSSLSQVQSYCQAQKKVNGFALEPEEKKEILASIEGKSKRETEKILASLRPENPLPEVCESQRPLNAEQTEICFVASEELMEKLKRIEELMSNSVFKPTYAELFGRMADVVLDRLDPIRKAKRTEKKKASQKKACQKEEKVLSPVEVIRMEEAPKEVSPELSCEEPLEDAREVAFHDQPKNPDELTRPSKSKSPDKSKISNQPRSRYISSQTRKDLWIKAQSRCCFVTEETGRRCSETRGLEMEHIVPWAKGGSNELSNLLLLCKSHNLLNAIKSYSPEKIKNYFEKNNSNVAW